MLEWALVKTEMEFNVAMIWHFYSLLNYGRRLNLAIKIKMFYKETGYFSESIYRFCLIFAFMICKKAIELQKDIMNYIKPFIMESCWVLDHHIELAKLYGNELCKFHCIYILFRWDVKKNWDTFGFSWHYYKINVKIPFLCPHF